MSREAMQMALDALESLQAWPETPENFKRFRAIEALRARLAQPDVPETAFGEIEPEPVAWLHMLTVDGELFPKPTLVPRSDQDIPLYTAQPRREWVGLTDEEIDEVNKGTNSPQAGMNFMGRCRNFAYAIEAKLKQLNPI